VKTRRGNFLRLYVLLNRDSKIAGGRFSSRARKEEVRTVPHEFARFALRNAAWSRRCVAGTTCFRSLYRWRLHRHRVFHQAQSYYPATVLHCRYIVIVRDVQHLLAY